MNKIFPIMVIIIFVLYGVHNIYTKIDSIQKKQDVYEGCIDYMTTVIEGQGIPIYLDSMLQRIPSERRDIFNKCMIKLPDFEYKVRGDERAYQIIYTNAYGKKQTITIDSLNDFN